MTTLFNGLLARCPTYGFPQWKLELDSHAIIYATAPLDYADFMLDPDMADIVGDAYISHMNEMYRIIHSQMESAYCMPDVWFPVDGVGLLKTATSKLTASGYYWAIEKGNKENTIEVNLCSNLDKVNHFGVSDTLLLGGFTSVWLL